MSQPSLGIKQTAFSTPSRKCACRRELNSHDAAWERPDLRRNADKPVIDPK